MRARHNQAIIRLLTPAVRGLFRACGGIRASGCENLPAGGGAILAPNHRSWADPPAVFLTAGRPCWFMANDFLFRIPILGSLIPEFGAFPVKRGTVDRDTLRTAQEYLQEGHLLCIFPEGGTTVTGTLYHPLEGGVALLAMRNHVPIIPVGITGSDGVLNAKPPYLHRFRGGVSVTYGKPLVPDELFPDLPRRERMDAITELLWDRIAELLPPDYLPAEKPGREPAGTGDSSG